MRSIKSELMIYLSLAIIAVIGLLSLQSYQSTSDELGELYDANMQHLAETVIENYSMYAPTENKFPFGKHKSGIRSEQDYLIELLDSQNIAYQSHQNALSADMARTGLSTQWIQHKRWRIYIAKDGALTSVVAQDYKLREATIRAVAFKLMIPQLLIVPFLIVCTLVVISKTIKPLAIISNQMASRSLADLHPLDEEHQPVELIPMIKALNRWMQKVSHSLKLQKRFTSDAAHELRTPVTALALQLSSLRNANQLQLKDQLPHLFKSLNRMERLVQQLLTLSRVDPETHANISEVVHINSVVVKVLNDLKPIYTQRNLDIGVTTTDEVYIMGAEDAIEIMLNNLLVNAINYSNDDGVINIKLTSSQAEATVEIEDFGPGIHQENIAKVFDRFYRSPDARGTGSGLGLAIVKEIATQHHAEIVLRNKPMATGLIATVTFRI